MLRRRRFRARVTGLGFVSESFVTAACLSYEPSERTLHWAYRVKEFVHDAELSDDLCLLAACIE